MTFIFTVWVSWRNTDFV